jgi:hypothetical protein
LPSIFISYRRQDTGGHVGRLADELGRRLRSTTVFFDVTAIPDGEDFITAIQEQIRKSDVVLIAIGRQWIDARDDQDRRRLDDPEDLVRLEIETALEAKVRIVPILIEDAAMPRADQLPGSIRKLHRLNARKLRNADWEPDIERLVAGLKQPFGLTAAATVFSIGALGIAVMRADQWVRSFTLATNPAVVGPFGPGPLMVDSMKRQTLFATLTVACSLGVALTRRGAPAGYRALIATGCAALMVPYALGVLFTPGFFPPGSNSTVAQISLAQLTLAQIMAPLAFVCWATAFAQRGARPSFWAIPYVIAFVAIETRASQTMTLPPLGTMGTVVVTVAAWLAFEAWRRERTRGLALAAVGTAAWLLVRFYHAYTLIPPSFDFTATYWNANSVVWSFLMDGATWLVAMSAGEGVAKSSTATAT